MSTAREQTLLKELHKAVSKYFKAENHFRANPSKETWDTRTECDAKLCGIMTEVGYYLKSIK